MGVNASIVTTKGRDEGADPLVPAFGIAQEWTIRGAMKLAESLRERRADVVHIQFPTTPYYKRWGIHVLPALLRHGHCKVVTTLHEYCLAPWGGRLKQLLNIWFSDLVITTTDLDRSLIGRWAGDSKVTLIPIGSNIPDVGTLTEGKGIIDSLGAGADQPPFLFFGFVRAGKGLEDVIDALSIATVTHPCNIVIVSPDPESHYRSELESRMRSAGVFHNVFWAGYRTEQDVSSLLKAGLAAVLPFQDGGTARRGSLLAALSHSLPVVTTQSQWTPSSFQHGVNMLLNRPGDVESLADNMLTMLRNSDKRTDIGHEGKRLSQEFEWSTIARLTMQGYQSVL